MTSLSARIATPRVVAWVLGVVVTLQIAGTIAGGLAGFLAASFGYLTAVLLALITSVRVARHGDPLERRSWQFFGAGFATMAAGALWAGVMGFSGNEQLSSYGEYGRIAAVPLLILGLRALPKGPHARLFVQHLLDSLTSFVCFVLIVWVLFNDVLEITGAVEEGLLFARATLNALLATSFVMALVAGRYAGGMSLRRLSQCAIGALLIAVGDTAMSVTGEGPEAGLAAWSMIPISVGILLFAAAAVLPQDGIHDSMRNRLLVGSISPLVPPIGAAAVIVFIAVRSPASDSFASLLVLLALGLLIAAVGVNRFDRFETRESMEARVTQRTMDIGTRERWFRALVQNSSDVVTVVDVEGTIRYQTPSALRVLGHDPATMIGGTLANLMRPADTRALESALRAAAATPDSVQTLEFPLWHSDGRWRETETTITSLVAEPHVRAIVLNTRDISERRRLQHELMHQAYSDALTGLANRSLFRERTRAALDAGAAHQVAVLFLDLNGFKSVNDTQGHAVGDRLLTLVGQRLKNCVRPGDLVARLGGDEFGVLVVGADAENGAIWVADRIRRVLAHDFELDNRKVTLGAAIGIALNERGDETADHLLSNADLAMYRAKTSDRTGFVRFETAMHDDLIERVQAEADLRAAVNRGDLRLHFQPIVELGTGEVVGVEALSRWSHPERGEIEPTEFIEVAEQTGLVDRIGTWALRESCRAAADWQRYAPPGQDVFRVAVNVSARQLTPVFPDLVRDALGDAGLPGSALTVEVTESALMERPEEAAEILATVKELGVKVAVDDFGTGYSSLAYLARFPVDILKIDRSFVEHVTTESEQSELARTVVQLGRALGLSTVAEGIENEAQHQRLFAMGCPLGQGFHFARPMPVDEVDGYLRERRPDLEDHAPDSAPTLDSALRPAVQ